MAEKKNLADSHAFLHCLAGGVGGTVGAIAMSPLEVLKIRLQSSQWTVEKKRPGIALLLRAVVRDEGALGLYKGLLPTLVGVLPSRSIFFMNYQFFKGVYRSKFESSSSIYFFSAISSSLVTSTVTNPIWYVKTRMQLDESRHRSLTAMQCVRDTWRASGFRGFFKGIQASYLGAIDTALHFAIYEYLKRFLISYNRRHEPGNNETQDPCRSQLQSRTDATLAMLASFVSKLTAISLSYPHEVLRTRLREPGNKYVGLWQTLRLVFKEEGLAGLYGGIGTHCIRVVPVTCITLGTYELVVYVMEEWHWIT